MREDRRREEKVRMRHERGGRETEAGKEEKNTAKYGVRNILMKWREGMIRMDQERIRK